MAGMELIFFITAFVMLYFKFVTKSVDNLNI